MNRQQAAQHLQDALASLKDFQHSTVGVLWQQLYEQDQRSMLVADEVGLGKTVVAKGLLARLLLHRIAEGKRGPLRVTYICTNQVIARENLRKLNLFPEEHDPGESISRISFLAAKPRQITEASGSQLLSLNTLTPATSFSTGRFTGVQRERAIIYLLLRDDPGLARKQRGLRWLLIGSVRKMERFERTIRWAEEDGVRSELPERFLAEIRKIPVPRTRQGIYDHLEGNRHRTLYEAVCELCSGLHDRRSEKVRHWACFELTRMLRSTLIDCCLDYVDADLYILDEFQRFRDLIDTQSEEEQALIARRIFGKTGTRTLLLSATPFKAFTGHSENAQGEDHFEDFRRVLRFLLDDDTELLKTYEDHRRALYKQLLELEAGHSQLSPEHRIAVEKILRSRICRTERHVVGAARNSLVADTWKSDILPFGTGDIRNFTVTDQLVRALEKVAAVRGIPIDYCKSALYPLSFLDGYQLKERLKANRDHPQLASALRRSRSAWIDLEKVDRYVWNLDPPSGHHDSAHAGLKLLAAKAIGDKGAEMLWIPPSLPYYPLERCFAGSAGFTKTLLFSSWAMVPRMVSTMLSYEAERLTIGNKASVGEQEKEERAYFQERRSPSPQIKFGARKHGEERQLANMSNFTLLYPSLSLVEVIQPVLNLGEGKSLDELKTLAAQRIKAFIESRRLHKHVQRSIGGERWYWAAPLLLDRASPEHRDVVSRWLRGGRKLWQRPTWFASRGEDAWVKEEHFEDFAQCFKHPEKIDFGPIPDDLPEILAELALGSPAVLALRSLSRLFPEEDTPVLMVHAFDVADQFCDLFNKPESIAAIRISARQRWYWRIVANYSAAGCLQAVLDEYLHLLKGQNLDLAGLMDQLREAINLNAASIKVDSLDTFLSDDSKKMRCHYASIFGNQDLDRESGQDRATGLREVFNSPFRPFVLTSTSIGQEGLDFHSYCRRIVHWNLPTNPIDLEQREGRINRYKSLVIRQHLAAKYRAELVAAGAHVDGDIWQRLFALAETHERSDPETCELVPFWHADTDAFKIERVIPKFPFSRDHQRLERILKTLAIYRLAFGQPRQEELVDHLLGHDLGKEDLETIRKTLIVDLCPISYRNVE